MDISLNLSFMFFGQAKAFQALIDFVDIIHSLQDVPAGQEANYGDEFIDEYINQWKPITELIDNLPKLKGVY